MDLKQKLLDSAPTKATRLALTLLIIGEGVIFTFVPFLNPITLELDTKNLTWLTLCLALCIALLFSIYINFHLTNRLKKISNWVNEQEWVKSDSKE